MKSAEGRHPVPTGLMAGPRILALFAEYGPSYRWYAVFTVMLASFTTLLTGTIINVAIPDIMGTFGMSSDQAQWVSTGYLAATTGFMLLTAWSVEAYGMRFTYLAAMGIFLVGSLMGGFAPTAEVMIVSRIVQGIAGGLMGPLSMLLITQVFPLDKRGMAMG
ncbi:MAG TPA: MFS transporter, partial [Pseudomonadales bacterium]|nr:MFS transporter [Pseudomonadales bacterium]HNB84176.1 MFS transporter [Pseudomonadales bacterium]